MKIKTTLSKQKSFIIVLSCLAAVIAVMCIVLPMVFKQQLNTVTFTTEKGDLAEAAIYDTVMGKSLKGEIEKMLSGEIENEYNVKAGETEDVRYTFRKNDVRITYQPYIFPEIARENIQRVTVTNPYGTFSLFNDTKGNFFIEGAEENLYNSQLVSELLLQARYMLADGYVENPKDYADYGLDEENCLATVVVTDTFGNTNTVYVGNNVISSGQYYMKHADKEHVYVMDSGAEVFFNDVRTYLKADIVRPIEEQQRNYIEKFTFNKNGSLFFACEIIPEEKRVGALSNQLHTMTYPAEAQVLNTTTLYDMFAVCGALSGAGVMEYGVSANERAGEILSFYGLDKPEAYIEFVHAGNNYSFSVGRSEEVDGIVYRYVYSAYQDTVVMVEESEMPFLGYEIMDLFQENVFQYNITGVESVELKYNGKTVSYSLSGEGEGLVVSETHTSKAIDTPSFRQFYISLLNVTIGGYSAFSGSPAETLPHMLTFTVTLKAGDKLVYDFYGESTMNCHMAIGGKAGFKTGRKNIEKIIENSEKLLSGTEIVSEF